MKKNLFRSFLDLKRNRRLIYDYGGKMKKIKVNAYLNANLGDDLFIKVLCERYKNVSFHICGNKFYKETLESIKNVKLYETDHIYRRVINRLFIKIGKLNYLTSKFDNIVDGVVHIGGSLFIEGEKWEYYFDNFTKKRFIEGKPFYLLGANFGPYEDKQYYKKHKEEFKKYTDICFREEYSYKKFIDLPNVRMAADIVFGLKTKKFKEKNMVVISVIKPSIRKGLDTYDELYYKLIRNICKKFIDNNVGVTLMSFCRGEKDEEAINEIKRGMDKEDKEKIFEYKYRTNMNEALKVIGEAKFIIATRFHAMILGFVFNKNVFPIAYSNKMLNILDDINFKGNYSDLRNLNSLSEETIYETFLNDTNYIDIEQQRRDAEKHFEVLDKFLDYNKETVKQNKNLM